jgi:hypothetical protein
MNRERKITRDYLKVNIKEEYLPVKLVDKINRLIFNNNKLEYRTKNNFLKCIGTIYFKQVNEYHNLEYYVPTGSAYWKTLFGGDYNEKVIQPLIDMKIIQFYDFGYRTFANKKTVGSGKQKGVVGKRYRITPDLISDDKFTMISYIQNGNTTILTVEEELLNGGKEFIYDTIKSKNLFVSIDKRQTSEWIENNAVEICKEYYQPNYVDQLPPDSLIEYHLFLDGGSFVSGFTTIRAAMLKATMYGKQLFYFKDKYYIADPQVFIRHRVNSLKHDYKKAISKIGSVPIIDRYSEKTLRLYNHLVNFPSKILQFININNRSVVQLDLRTSQFLIFANILNTYINTGEITLLKLFEESQTQAYLKRLIKVLKEHQYLLPRTGVSLTRKYQPHNSTNDVVRFINDVFHTDFYTVIQKELSLPDRNLAKQMLFRLLFKRGNKPDLWIKMLETLYPTVMSIINGFKQKESQDRDPGKSYSDDDWNNFSVFLQCVESEIFINKIFKPLRDAGVPCFSRHDSIVVATGYEDQAELYARSIFEQYGFKYNHKVEDKLWEVCDEEFLEGIGYMDWLMDENELNTIFNIDDIPTGDAQPLIEIEVEEDDDIEVLDDEQISIVEELLSIGEQNDYSALLGIGFLEALTILPLNENEKNLLYDEIINLRSGFLYFHDSTNKLILQIVKRYDGTLE